MTIAIAVTIALIASTATLIIKKQQGDDSSALNTASAVVDITMPHSGMIVSLSRPGFVDLPASIGLENAVVVSVTADRPVVAVELLDGATVVSRVVPASPVAERADRMTWIPLAEGVTTLIARAYDGDGHVGQSNPLRIDARRPESMAGLVPVSTAEGDSLASLAAANGVEVTTLALLNGLDASTASDPIPAGTPLDVPVAAPAPFESEPTAVIPLPDSLELAQPPTLQIGVDGCAATVDAKSGGSKQKLILFRVPPTGGAVAPVAKIGGNSVVVPLTSGVQDFVVAAGVDDELVAWSLPVSVTAGSGCSGWSGDVRFEGGVLVADTEAESAYVYLSTTVGEWVRVPPTGFVPRGSSGFDFSKYLPPLVGSTVKLEAWGRLGGKLVLLGTGVWTPPTTAGGDNEVAIVVSDEVGLPKSQLWWLRPADWKHNGQPPKAVTAGDVLAPDVLRFQWSSPFPGITHGIVQVTSSAVPPTAGPKPGGVLYQDVVQGRDGTFDIDFAKVFDSFYAHKNGTIHEVSETEGSGTYVTLAGLGGSPGGSPAAEAVVKSTVGANPHPVDLDPTDGPGPGDSTDSTSPDETNGMFSQTFVVRVVPMAADNWGGLVTNDVDLTVDPTGRFQVAPAGEKPYNLDVALVTPPRPPDPNKTRCWQFAGWTDDDAVKAEIAKEKLAAEQASAQGQFPPASANYVFWSFLVDQLGQSPICGGCYHFGSTSVALAGGKCDDGGFLDDLVGAFKTFVNMLSSAYAFIKSTIVDLVVTASGCKALGSGAASFCNTLASVVLDAALTSLGIPPSLPNWDQLIAAAKGDIVAIGVGLATQLGVPCDDADFAAEVHGNSDLTCEAALNALLDEAVAQIDQMYSDTSTSMGFSFPPMMRVRPHPDGQIGPASVAITVNPTKYSNAEAGKTCSVGLYPKSTWFGSPDILAGFVYGATVGGPIVSGVTPGSFPGASTAPMKIPHLFWSDKAFETGFFDLPHLTLASVGSGLAKPETGLWQPVTKTYDLYPPFDAELVPVTYLSSTVSYTGINPGVGNKSGKPLVNIHQSQGQLPKHVFLLNKGAVFSIFVLSPCAAGGGLHRWSLPGFDAGPAVELK